MAEGTVLIEGKEFVSSERASKLVGYTKDYVGQLARAGKIEAKRIGRSWYISQNSITKHKLSVHYTLTKPKKPIKKESDANEVPNLHISNATSSVEKVERDIATKGDISDKKATEDSEEFDLIPRLVEKKRDVLLHTDIRYENSTPTPPQKRDIPLKKEESHFYKSVPIRKPVKRTERKNHSFPNNELSPRLIHKKEIHTQTQGVRIDGIRVPNTTTSHRLDVPQNVYQKKSFQTEPHTRRGNERVLPKEVYEEEVRDTSKVIPVVGAIVVFTIFVVIYIFVTS